MNRVAVVYWSGTGHTQAMAEAVASACSGKLMTAAEVTPDQVAEYDAIAFGCPAMGAEVLEESEFQPMFDDVKPQLKGKKIALFGSYGLGRRRMDADLGRRLRGGRCGTGLRQRDLSGRPDGDALASCDALGKALAE